jgi:soluble lytic murein transglycosylase
MTTKNDFKNSGPRSPIRIQYMGAFLSSLFALGLYQNFDSIQRPLSKVNQESRTAHARELLGVRYKGSQAQRAEKMLGLNKSIFTALQEGLPTAYKTSARKVAQTIIDEAEFYEVDPVLVLALIKTESQYNPLARGQFGEIGLMQVKPDTAEWIANKEGLAWKGAKTLEDPVTNIRIGMAYVNYLRTTFEGSANKYLSAYNMGAKNVRKRYAEEQKPKQYSIRVMKNYRELYAQMVSPRGPAEILEN